MTIGFIGWAVLMVVTMPVTPLESWTMVPGG
jgi:hypothetical protein